MPPICLAIANLLKNSLKEGNMAAGVYSEIVEGSYWTPGPYLCAMKCDAGQKVIRILKA